MFALSGHRAHGLAICRCRPLQTSSYRSLCETATRAAPPSHRTSSVSMPGELRVPRRSYQVPQLTARPSSIWFEQCQQQKWQRAHPQSGMNPALRVFPFRLANLVQQPIQLIFCYDGPNRPARKRGKKVGMHDHWMVNPTHLLTRLI